MNIFQWNSSTAPTLMIQSNQIIHINCIRNTTRLCFFVFSRFVSYFCGFVDWGFVQVSPCWEDGGRHTAGTMTRRWKTKMRWHFISNNAITHPAFQKRKNAEKTKQNRKQNRPRPKGNLARTWSRNNRCSHKGIGLNSHTCNSNRNRK